MSKAASYKRSEWFENRLIVIKRLSTGMQLYDSLLCRTLLRLYVSDADAVRSIQAAAAATATYYVIQEEEEEEEEEGGAPVSFSGINPPEQI